MVCFHQKSQYINRWTVLSSIHYFQRQNVPKYPTGQDVWPLPEALARITRIFDLGQGLQGQRLSFQGKTRNKDPVPSLAQFKLALPVWDGGGGSKALPGWFFGWFLWIFSIAEASLSIGCYQFPPSFLQKHHQNHNVDHSLCQDIHSQKTLFLRCCSCKFSKKNMDQKGSSNWGCSYCSFYMVLP